MTRTRRALQLIFVTLLLANSFTPPRLTFANTDFQQTTPEEKARNLLEKMSSEERVGQLFLVSFKGSDGGEKNKINDLVSNYSIGGVILSAANDNFNGPENLLVNSQKMISSLQTARWNNSNEGGKKGEGVPTYIPLFVGISQEGDLAPNDQILSGVTALPSLMAIGATWDPSYAREIGIIMGRELAAIGFNLYLGPSLDVPDLSQVDGIDSGAGIFGGNPYWIGEMGKAFIQGLHTGSYKKMAVIAKHFPGQGGVNRSPEEEIATVRKPIEQLIQVNLAPFFATADAQAGTDVIADGFMSSNTRFQGFQGSIRETTKPISLDAAAMEQLLAYPQFIGWRQNGGMLVSDDLSSQAIRKFYDPLSTNFDARQVARDAFFSGNDMIFLGNFTSTGDPDNFVTIVRTLEFFSQKYREDSAFAKKVDISVLRILASKFKIYPDFSRYNVITQSTDLKGIGEAQDVVMQVAQKAASLVSPGPADIGNSLPHPPDKNEKILFISDTLIEHQCSTCPEQYALPYDGLQNSVLKLYGPNASGQVFPYRMISHSFLELMRYLNNEEELSTIEENIQNADWIVFSILNIQSARPESYALKRLLAERPELLRNKKVVVFAFNAPYYLDATDISKITAYYCLYSKAEPFIDIAARILYQEFVPTSSLPVSVPGVGYDLGLMTSPDPNQIIPILVDSEAMFPLIQNTTAEPALTPTINPTNVPRFKVSDTLPLMTGIIYDRNRNPVPDGTTVRFLFTKGGEGGTVQQIETLTQKGVARSSYRIVDSGLLEIRVISGSALASQILQLDINPGESAAITAIAPTSIVITATPQLTQTPAIPSTASTPVDGEGDAKPPSSLDWLISMIFIWGCGSSVVLLTRKRSTLRWALRYGFSAVIAGSLAYIYISLNLPGSITLLENYGRGIIYFVDTAGILLGWAGGFLWEKFTK